MEETEWLKLETQVRKLVKELISPTIQRSKLNERLIMSLETSSKSHSELLGSLDLKVKSIDRKLEILEEYSKRLYDIDSTLRVLTAKSAQDREDTVLEIDTLNKQLCTQEEKLEVLEKHKMALKEEISLMKKDLLSTKSHVDNQVLSIKEETRHKLQELNDGADLHSKELRFLKDKMTEVSETTAEMEIISRRADKTSEDNRNEIANMNRKNRQAFSETKNNFEKVSQMVMRFDKRAREMNKQLKEYIYNQLPLKQFLNGVDLLYNTNKQMRVMKRIAEYEKHVYENWEDLELSDDILQEVSNARIRMQEVLDAPFSSDDDSNVSDESENEIVNEESQEDDYENEQVLEPPGYIEIENEQEPVDQTGVEGEGLGDNVQEAQIDGKNEEKTSFSPENNYLTEKEDEKESNFAIKSEQELDIPIQNERVLLDNRQKEDEFSAGIKHEARDISAREEEKSIITGRSEAMHEEIAEINKNTYLEDNKQTDKNETKNSKASEDESTLKRDEILQVKTEISKKDKDELGKTKQNNIQEKSLDDHKIIEHDTVKEQDAVEKQEELLNNSKLLKVDKPETIEDSSKQKESISKHEEDVPKRNEDKNNEKIPPDEISKQEPLQEPANDLKNSETITIIEEVPSTKPMQKQTEVIPLEEPLEEPGRIPRITKKSNQKLSKEMLAPSDTPEKGVPDEELSKALSSLQEVSPVTLASKFRSKQPQLSKLNLQEIKIPTPSSGAQSRSNTKKPTFSPDTAFKTPKRFNTITSKQSSRKHSHRSSKSSSKSKNFKLLEGKITQVTGEVQKTSNDMQNLRKQQEDTISEQSFKLSEQETSLNAMLRRIDKMMQQMESQSESHLLDIQGVTIALGMFKQEFQDTLTYVDLRFEEFKQDTFKLTNSLEILVKQAIYECNEAFIQRRRDHSDNTTEFKRIKEKQHEIIVQQQNLESTLSLYGSVIDSLIEHASISNSLQGQDEVDRESIALLGVNEKAHNRSKSNAPKPVLTLDKQCLSCAGQANSVMSAFKIACLAYTPSKVLFRSSVFNRKELIEIQSRLIQNVWKLNDKEEEQQPPRSRSELGRYVTPTPRFHASTAIELPPIATKSNRLI